MPNLRYRAVPLTYADGELVDGLTDINARQVVTIGSNTAALASTGTQSIVASSGSSVTLLAANANRKGASIYNDSTQVLYLLESATVASNTVYTLQLSAGAYYEITAGYTGEIRGIWASANGNARVTELT